MQWSAFGLTLHAMPTQLCDKPKNCPNKSKKCLGDSFEAVSHSFQIMHDGEDSKNMNKIRKFMFGFLKFANG